MRLLRTQFATFYVTFSLLIPPHSNISIGNYRTNPTSSIRKRDLFSSYAIVYFRYFFFERVPQTVQPPTHFLFVYDELESNGEKKKGGIQIDSEVYGRPAKSVKSQQSEPRGSLHIKLVLFFSDKERFDRERLWVKRLTFTSHVINICVHRCSRFFYSFLSIQDQNQFASTDASIDSLHFYLLKQFLGT